MDARAFNREKMQWLNALNLESAVNPTAFRVAYLIADHHNRVQGFAWPSRARLAGKFSLSGRTIQRAVVQLEDLGWLSVDRRKDRSNHYRMTWPPGRKPSTPQNRKAIEEDKIVNNIGQICPVDQDKPVSQSYLFKHSKNFSSRLGEGRMEKRFSDRGKYEAEIVRKYGPDMIELLEKLNEIEAGAVERLCQMERDRTLKASDIASARLAVAQCWKPK